MIFEKPEEPGKKYALTFTVLVHLGLLAFLFVGVQWKRSQPVVYDVELWAPTPRQAQTLPPPPPPRPEPVPEPKPQPKPIPKLEPKPEPLPPKKPDIAVKEEKKKPEPKKPEPPKPEPPKPEPKKPEPKKPEPKKPEPKKSEPAKPEPKVAPRDAFKEALEREETQRRTSDARARMAAQAESEQRAAANTRGLADYASKIRGKIRGNIVLPPGIQGNPEAIFKVNQLPGGEILDVHLKHSSGNQALDAAIERAIRKSSPLPKPDNPSLFERELEIKYKPIEE